MMLFYYILYNKINSLINSFNNKENPIKTWKKLHFQTFAQ